MRSKEKLAARPWVDHPNVEIVGWDLERDDPAEGLRGCRAAFYLIHSMLAVGSDYAEADRRLATAFAQAAASAEIDRIIYLGGLGETGEDLSEHLRSRRQVEEALASGPVPVTTYRAAMIIGSGSASFEILRYLVERLPLMLTPRWVRTRCQPIAVRDVLFYLTACLDEPRTVGATLDIGGPNIVTYLEMIQQTAQARGLPRRWVVRVPVLTPRLSSLWIHLVTPMSARIARPLAEGLRNEVICRDDRANEWMPHDCLTVDEAIAAALEKADSGRVETRWSDAGAIPGDPDWAGGTSFTDARSIEIEASPDAVYRAVCRVGGGHGWYAANGLWRLRGAMDKLVGGPGLRRGRRDPETVGYGEALDFWRVTGIERNRRLELRAEMKLPGVATLEFDIEPGKNGSETCTLTQTARFKPKGLFGLAYWYAVLPLHGIVFRGMMGGIRRQAVQVSQGESTAPAGQNP